MTIAGGLVDRGHEPVVIILSDRADEAMVTDLRDSRVPFEVIGAKRIFDAGAWRSVRRQLDLHRVEIVHTQLEASDVIGTVLARRRRIPSLTTQHVFSSGDDTRSNARIRVQHAVLRRWAGVVVAVSRAGRDHLVDNHRHDPDRVEVVNNGVDTERFAPPAADQRKEIRAGLDLPDDCQVLMTCSVLRPAKGIQHLLSAMPEIIRAEPRTRLVVVGGGSHESVLRSQCEELGLCEEVQFTGQRTDIESLLAAADIVVHPSLEDVLPTSIIEAMAAARPVVASDTGGIPEIVVDGESGILVTPGDSQDLTHSLVSLMENPAKRNSMGEAGRLRAESQFSIQQQLDRLEEIYSRLTNSRGRRP